MSFEHGTRLTFASLDRDSDTLAGNLTALGVAPGDRVMAVLKNRLEFMLTMIATLKTGAIFVPVNTELKDSPELINEECYDDGWLIRLELINPEESADLLSAEEYEEFILDEES